jgi:hypothetical protein
VRKGRGDAGGPTPALVAAYRAADYHVTGVPVPFVLNVDVASAALAAGHRAHGVRRSAFLSACNPRSRLADPNDNRLADERLAARLCRLGFVPVAGHGADPAGRWPDEPSWWVPGLGVETASVLGHTFGQHGILAAGADAVPRLVLLREPPPRELRGTDR